ncbi:MAG: ATP synthase F1 subunit delta [Gemmatimonadaceae bacterium]
MRPATIARNYAETLLTLAQKAEDTRGWGKMLSDVSAAMGSDVTLRRFLESPNVSAEQKKEILGKAFADRAPRLFVRFLQALVTNRRQMLIPQIATEYFALLDVAENRIHAEVTLAKAPSDEDTARITSSLRTTLGKDVVAHVNVDPKIIGGIVVKMGDTVMDGSVRRRLGVLRRAMIAGGERR